MADDDGKTLVTGETEGAKEGKGTEGAKEGKGTEGAKEGKGTEGAKESEGTEGAKEGKGTEGAKESEGTEGAKDGAPETYKDFTLPEGMEVDKVALETFLPVAKELNLTQDQAQKLVDLKAQEAQKSAEAQQVAWQTMVSDWRKETEADSEIGGAKLEKNLSVANKALDKLGTPALNKFLDTSGAGNNIELVRFFVKVGEAIGEDTMSFGAEQGQTVDPAKVLFPDQN